MSKRNKNTNAKILTSASSTIMFNNTGSVITPSFSGSHTPQESRVCLGFNQQLIEIIILMI